MKTFHYFSNLYLRNWSSRIRPVHHGRQHTGAPHPVLTQCPMPQNTSQTFHVLSTSEVGRLWICYAAESGGTPGALVRRHRHKHRRSYGRSFKIGGGGRPRQSHLRWAVLDQTTTTIKNTAVEFPAHPSPSYWTNICGKLKFF